VPCEKHEARTAQRLYISTVTQQQNCLVGESPAGHHTVTLIKTFKRLTSELWRKDGYLPMLEFAKKLEAAVDDHQLSIGNQEEVERSRAHTIYVRRQMKPQLVEEGYVTANDPFEQEGVWEEHR